MGLFMIGFGSGWLLGMLFIHRLFRWSYGVEARTWQASSERAWADRDYWQREFYRELRRVDDSGEEWKRGIHNGEHE